MNLYVVNKELCVGDIKILAVVSSAVVLIGDAQVITQSSIFDTPPEALQIGPLVPLAPPAGG